MPSTTTGHSTHDIVIVDGVPVTEPTTGTITTAVAIESESPARALLMMQHRRPQRRLALRCGLFVALVLFSSVAFLFAHPSRSSSSKPARSPRNASAHEIYLGNGCFWERQWAYYKVETNPVGPFAREPNSFSAKVGYAGGNAPPESEGVCYHSGDSRDYSALGHAEAVRVVLDPGPQQHQQMLILATDYFASFTGPHGQRSRPDPMDAGAPYRSFAGFPGGMSSPLYTTFAAANAFGMVLKPGNGGDTDEVRRQRKISRMHPSLTHLSLPLPCTVQHRLDLRHQHLPILRRRGLPSEPLQFLHE